MTTNGNQDNPLVQSLTNVSIRRTQRLLGSFDALEGEILGNTLTTSRSPSLLKIESDPLWFSLHDFGQQWWKSWETSLERARGVQVQRNSLTEEFSVARNIGLGRDPYTSEWQAIEDRRNWAYYQLHRLSRNKWGQYFRSNMDWDWDLGTCMKCMFVIEKEACAGPSSATTVPQTSRRATEVATMRDGTLRISLGEPQGDVPNVQVEYKTKTGETHTILFVPKSRCPEPSSYLISEHSSAQRSTQETEEPNQYRKSFPECYYDGTQEIEKVTTSRTSRPRDTVCLDSLFMDCKDAQKGEHTVDNGKLEEVLTEGDEVISICSLD